LKRLKPVDCQSGRLQLPGESNFAQLLEGLEFKLTVHWATCRIAIDYWRLPENATILDMLYAIRTDEAGHRFYNHSIANLKDYDFNPFAIRKPSGELQGTNIGFTREQGLEWYEGAAKELEAVKGRRMNEEHIERSAKGGKEAKREGETPTFSTP
jgi:ubiquinol oxidase